MAYVKTDWRHWLGEGGWISHPWKNKKVHRQGAGMLKCWFSKLFKNSLAIKQEESGQMRMPMNLIVYLPLRRQLKLPLRVRVFSSYKEWLFLSYSHCFDVSSYQWRNTELSMWTLLNNFSNVHYVLKKYFNNDVIVVNGSHWLCFMCQLFNICTTFNLCWTVHLNRLHLNCKNILIQNKDTRWYFRGSVGLREAQHFFFDVIELIKMYI